MTAGSNGSGRPCAPPLPKAPDATLAVVSSGPADQFYLDHHIYAQEMNAILAETRDLELDGGGYLVHRPTGRRVDVIYERVDEDTLYAEVPGLLECHVEGKVHVLFAPNSEIIDDKGVGAFVPEMVRRYLGEEPLIENARTWSLAVEEERRYVMEHFGELVVKSRGGYGGKEVMIGPEETRESVERFRRMVEDEPRRVRGPGDDRFLHPRPVRGERATISSCATPRRLQGARARPRPARTQASSRRFRAPLAGSRRQASTSSTSRAEAR